MIHRRACLTLLLLGAGCAVPARAAESAALASARAVGEAFAAVYEKVAPSVVVLEVSRPGGEEEFSWQSLFGPRGRRLPRAEESEGSGFFIREDGYLLTNAHVVEGADPEKGVMARLRDGTRLPLRIVGVDEKTDLAVLKAARGGAPAIEWGDSERARVGELVCSIGAPFELAYTFTTGVLSAKGRSNLTDTVYEDYLQTDAAINPGNSGGPLCDLDGRVLGVNTLINGINSGLAFAIPSALARAVSDELIARGRVTRPWLGIIIRTLGDAPDLHGVFGRESGVIVTSLPPDGPAASSRLRPSDVIVEVDGEPVQTSRELQQKILRKKVGQKVDLKVWRRGAGGEGAFLSVPVTTGELPPGDSLAGPVPSEPPRRPSGRAPESPLFGLEVQAVTGRLAGELGVAEGGVIVTYVEPDSPAEVAGLKVRDIITSVGPQAVSDAEEFAAALAGLKPKEAVVLNVERGGQKTYAILQK